MILFLKRFFLLLSVLIAVAAKGQKTDTLILINGNIITGEIKKLDYGRMLYKVSGLGSVNVKRENIRSLKSGKKFEILLDDGNTFFGSLDTAGGKSGTVKINYLLGHDTLPIDRIVEIYPIKNSFWKRISGGFDVGFSYSKGSKIGRFSFSGTIRQKSRKFDNNILWDNMYTYSEDSLTSQKSDLTFYSLRRLKKGWSVGGFLGYNINSELGIDLRLMMSLVANYDLVYTQRNRLYLLAGPVQNMEWDRETDKPENNFEGIVSVGYKYYKYSSPQLQVNSLLSAFPGFTSQKRWRINYSFNANVEIISDFYVGAKFYIEYDNRKTLEESEQTDWGTTLTVGYTFN